MGIVANTKCMIMGFRETEFIKNEGTKDQESIKSIKVKIHDKSSKTDLECKFAGTIEEFFNLQVEEYETYNITLDFSPYMMAGRTNISCKIVDIAKK